MVALTPMATRLPAREKNGFRADIQGLRAVAVLQVVAYHATPGFLSGGYIGVDVFFVISGFLITTHLLRSLDADGSISLAAFYARRALRILPAAFTVLVLTLLAALVWMPPLQHESVFEWAVAAAVYAPNVLAGLLSTDYLAESVPSVFQHYWSLGVEEQFYVLWPAILLLGWRVLGRSEKRLFATTGGLVAVSFVLGLVVMQFSQPWAFFSLPTRGWELGTGTLVAFLLRRGPAWPGRLPAGIMAWAGLTAVLLAAFAFDSETPFPGYHAAVPVIGTALVIVGGTGRMGPARMLGIQPLQFIGLLSYSLYLVHWPLLVIPQAAVGYAHPLPLELRLFLGALAIPVAYLLFRLVEDPVRRARPLTSMPPVRTLLSAVGATLLIFALAVGGSAVQQRVPLDAGRATPEAPLTPYPSGTGFVPSNLAPSLRESTDDVALLYRNGCAGSLLEPDASGCQFGRNDDAPVVALFGDSHAASWFPALHALAEDGRIRLDISTMGTCPSAVAATPLERTPAARCDGWREDVIQRLNAEPPAVILLANYAPRYEPRGDADFADRWAEGLAATIDSLPEASRVGVIADVPDMGVSPAICLSDNVESADTCAVPRSEALRPDLAAAERAAAGARNAAYLDLTDHFCNRSDCPSVIGNLLTHRDGDHLTATFAEALAEPLWQELEPLVRR